MSNATNHDGGTPAAPIPGFTSETADVGGVRLHYRLGGDPEGQPVLLWHGFLGTGYTWRKVAPALADAGMSVLVPDMRGYGDSDKPDGTEGYDARALAEEFRALVRRIGFGAGRPIVLAAHDMGAPPALLWAADHPDEVAGLLYIEEPPMLSEVLSNAIAFTPEAMGRGPLWWWILPFAPGVPEGLIVGNERAFLTWFYDRYAAERNAIEPAAVDEYLRTFSGREGVLGALGVYRAAFATMEQTAPLKEDKVRVPVVALGGGGGGGGDTPPPPRGCGGGGGGAVVSLGGVRPQPTPTRRMLGMVAEDVGGGAVSGGAHFLPEERPEEVAREVMAVASTGDRR